MKHLSLIGRHMDAELGRIHATIDGAVVVSDRMDVEELCSTLLRHTGEPAPMTLDLIGHSIAGSSLLQLGDWVIDGAAPVVTAFFRGLVDDDIFGRLRIEAIRLLGCHTAETQRGRATIRALAEITGIEVSGTRGVIYASHYDAQGFKDEWRFLLAPSSDLGESPEPPRAEAGMAITRSLDIDALPARLLGLHDRPWPRVIATRDVAQAVLRLVDRAHGAMMPGLLSQPSCELMLPAPAADHWHPLQVVLDHRFVRVYPDGDHQPGVLYPVLDPHALVALCQSLAQRTPSPKLR